jgi:hypothetical protein
MSTKAALPWYKVEHSWSDTSIYDAGQNPVFTSSIRDEATEDNQDELEAKQAEVIDFTITAVNHHDELRTRLYNLKNAVDCLSGVGELGVTYTVNDAWAKVDLAMKDASETLKKLIK